MDSVEVPLLYIFENFHQSIVKLRIIKMNSSEEAQKAHYNKISDAYAAHYGDKWSQKYRK